MSFLDPKAWCMVVFKLTSLLQLLRIQRMALAEKCKTIFLNYYSSLIILIYMFFSVTHSIDTISLGESLSQNQTIISDGRNFELGFFSPDSSVNYYIGIWYKNIRVKTVVWVANRNNPIPSSSILNSTLQLSNGSLNLYNGLTRTIIWTTSSMIDHQLYATEAKLLDTGNLVLRGGSRVLWQSFDYPSDTWMPGGRIGFDKTNNRSIVLTSWRNSQDPAPGTYLVGSDGPEFFMMRNLTRRYWRSGEWKGLNFTLTPVVNGTIFNLSFHGDYFTYSSQNTITTRVVISSSGLKQRLIWLEAVGSWAVYSSEPNDPCGVYEVCGPFGICNVALTPICSCLPGFVPRFQRDWDLSDFSSGCVRITPLQCDEDRKKFVTLTNILPTNSQSLAVDNTETCESACSSNCSCNAYSLSSSGGTCLLWNGDLLDLQNRTNGRDFFLKLGVEILNNNHSRKKRILYTVIPLSVTLVLATVAGVLCFFRLRRKNLKQTEARGMIHDLSLLNLDNSSKLSNHNANKSGKEQKVLELPMFSLLCISNATDKFSSANKLGEGGFGPVYKGNILNGQSIAVKRLSKLSGQGLEELRNEVILIAKLQHKNLVRLLGYCTEKDEKILIYEYMPNKSLDSFLFDPTRKELLNWSRRVRIIDGIVQGLLYLHEYSRLRVVHRDLKASNILLDGDMNPKISDFGMARIFGENDLHANTNRIVGTFGYMSPEYAMEGRFSIKSDVFAFGILLLEILSGKKNTGFRDSDFLSLLGYVWNIWENERALELIDPILEIPTSSSTIALRYIVVGLLCVQENPDDRPTMYDVLSMISNEQATLASPKRPGFIARRTLVFASSDRVEAENGSINYLTTSAMEAR